MQPRAQRRWRAGLLRAGDGHKGGAAGRRPARRPGLVWCGRDWFLALRARRPRRRLPGRRAWLLRRGGGGQASSPAKAGGGTAPVPSVSGVVGHRELPEGRRLPAPGPQRDGAAPGAGQRFCKLPLFVVPIPTKTSLHDEAGRTTGIHHEQRDASKRSSKHHQVDPGQPGQFASY